MFGIILFAIKQHIYISAFQPGGASPGEAYDNLRGGVSKLEKYNIQ